MFTRKLSLFAITLVTAATAAWAEVTDPAVASLRQVRK